MIFAALAAVSLSAAVFPAETEACSRIVYHGTDSLYIVGRSLDWKTPIPTNVYVYPSGMSKKGNLQPDAVRWTSRYGAVYAVGYDGGVTEGMNEKGLVINGLFCKGSRTISRITNLNGCYSRLFLLCKSKYTTFQNT